jgi:transposase-like protein
MKVEQQWCDNQTCVDVGKIGAGNIQVFSHVAQRYYCTSCGRTFSADKGTCFETIRQTHETVIEILALLQERNSLRAIERLKQVSPNRILFWLALAGQHAARLSLQLIHNLHLSQVQIDELWTFVKKTRTSSAR